MQRFCPKHAQNCLGSILCFMYRISVQKSHTLPPDKVDGMAPVCPPLMYPYPTHALPLPAVKRTD
eukprot:5893832-Pleurochrysis_carterae.AAC.1